MAYHPAFTGSNLIIPANTSEYQLLRAGPVKDDGLQFLVADKIVML